MTVNHLISILKLMDNQNAEVIVNLEYKEDKYKEKEGKVNKILEIDNKVVIYCYEDKEE